LWGASPLAVAGATGAAGSAAVAAVPAASGWGKAIQVPGTAPLTKGGAAFANWVSCPSTGNCAAGGSYADCHGHLQGFVVSQI
jgi:hypothetical protein